MTEFLHMGGYGFYVWTSYGLAALVLALNLVAAIRRRRSVVRQLSRRLKKAV
ncbi:MAG: heme exporter protein CcmD [Gammaproteobacteria bacterium]|nr:heme exporter protein CcmD [Gammaproteobacteria bacterium]